MALLPNCQAGCEHGGICELPVGHDGGHKAGPCTFTDDQGLTREESDAIIAQTTFGRMLLSWQKALEEIILSRPEPGQPGSNTPGG